jgi:PLP dependent protein
MTILKRLHQLQLAIHQAEQCYHRQAGHVQLLAVSKQQPIEAIREAVAGGQLCFGENYVQEALQKITALADLPLEWHFIGTIQSNKTQAIATHFSWVHSLDRLSIARRLNQQRPPHLPKLNVCIEVNISQENTKSGVTLDALSELAHAVNSLENLHLRGLMAIPHPMLDFAEQRVVYQHVQAVYAELCAQGLALDTLSMGMSGDFVAAIAAGSTIVRIGAALFGPR